VLLSKGLEDAAGAISDARDSLDGSDDLDQGIVDGDGNANLVPTDANGIAFSRDVFQVHNIAYLTPEEAAPAASSRRHHGTFTAAATRPDRRPRAAPAAGGPGRAPARPLCVRSSAPSGSPAAAVGRRTG
jgi:hypothetical protein